MKKIGSRKVPKWQFEMLRQINASQVAFRKENPGASLVERGANVFRQHFLRGGISPTIVELTVALCYESDRGFVLVLASLIDEQIEALIRRFFLWRNPSGEQAIGMLFKASKENDIPPLQNTALKIRLAWVLGLIDERLKEACVKVQRLRSRRFAHTGPQKFLRIKDVEELVESFPDVWPTKVEGDPPPGVNALVLDENNPRVAYCTVAIALALALERAGKELKTLRKKASSMKA